MYFPGAITTQPQINAAVGEVVRDLAPSVVHIRYDIGQDWSGDWAIFFRVLLSDEASKAHNLQDVTSQVEEQLYEKIDFRAIGLFAYFNYRNQSEQAKMLEPAWA
jgi:hypothetical protein